MLARLSRAAALAGLLCLPLPVGAADAPSPDDSQALDIRRLSPDQRRRLLAGDTIGYQVAETTETELGAGVAMYLPVPLARMAEVLTSPDIVVKDPSISDWGALAPGATVAALAGYKLAGGDVAEAQDAFDAAPAGRLNLSAAEIEAFRAARPARGADRAAVAESGAAQWRGLPLPRPHQVPARRAD